ncbi:hypothetical protein F5I97DRAFT_1958341 [Phlebopus sp. FC_14]|nr:hypothetical protein F5I97DRAFT_1958341 [Phlebopus sp. FC_14]
MSRVTAQQSPRENSEASSDHSEKQCRICFEGDEADPSQGRLFKPCLCTGSISYVHVKCLQRWRTSSSSSAAFYRCPQCQFHYRFARTKAHGLAANPIVVGILSSFFFTLLVMCSSYLTTYFLSYLEEQPVFSMTYIFISPIDVGQDLLRAAIRILRDQEVLPPDADIPQLLKNRAPAHLPEAPSLLKRFVQRFIIGLPMIGAGSLIHMFLTLPLLGPLQWVARWRVNRGRRGNNTDMAAAVIVIFLILGAARALQLVYNQTRKLTEKVLYRAESAILEVG